VKQGEGVGAVRDLLESWSERFRPSVDDLAVNGRQRELLEAISQGLDRVSDGLQRGEMMELLAEEIRLVHGHLSVLIGETTPDDVLERVFSSFCIGK
jgi:tRNA modification GTPase